MNELFLLGCAIAVAYAVYIHRKRIRFYSKNKDVKNSKYPQ